jgi:hypothetical protein
MLAMWVFGDEPRHAGDAMKNEDVVKSREECLTEDERYFDDEFEGLDDFMCDRCRGDGMDPWSDYLFPCPACQGDYYV